MTGTTQSSASHSTQQAEPPARRHAAETQANPVPAAAQFRRAPTAAGVLALQRKSGNRSVARVLAGRIAPHRPLTLQRETDAERNKRIEAKAKEIWQKKGSPPNQTKEQMDADWKEAEKQISISDRAFGVWQEKGSPQNQTEEQKKKDWSEAEAQIELKGKLASANNEMLMAVTLGWAKGVSLGWPAFRFGMQSVRPAADIIRGNGQLLTDLLAFCKTKDEKAEAIALLRGDIMWKMPVMIAQGVDSETYLNACVRLKIFEPGVTAEDNKTHTKAEDADDIIQKKLGALVADAAKKGRKITGKVMVVDDADWHIAGINHYGADKWLNGGKWDAINGFVDAAGRVIIHKDRGNAGTTIHEGLHKYSDGAYLSTLGFQLNEGATEYFTRKIADQLDPPIVRGNYQPNWELTVALKDIVGEDKLAPAYFDGAVDALKNAFISARSADKWTTLLTKAAAADWVAARAALDA